MNVFLKKILLFGESNQKRDVTLFQNLNIVTGASQTGKSALIEIVDYCLCSKFSSIPRGKIYDWTDLYSIIFQKGDSFLIIGRSRFEDSGAHKMYLKIENDNEFLDNISLSYFSDQPLQKLTSVKKQIGQFFGITVKNTNETYHTKNFEGHSASVRNITSFMFQHQNLIASKHALFCRFDDAMRKKNTINQLPVFLGWVGDEYYTFIREKEIIQDQITRLEKLIVKEKKITENQSNDLKSHFKNYYSIIGKKFQDQYSYEELLILRKQLPDYTQKTFVNQTISSRYLERKDYRDKLKEKRDIIQKRINDIIYFNNYTSDYQIRLLELRDKSKKGVKIQNGNLSCPLCGNDSKKALINELTKVNEATQNLNNELVKTKVFKEDYTSELQKLELEKSNIDDELRKVNSHIKHIERQFEEIKNYKSTSERAIYAKAKLDFIIDNLSNASILENLRSERKKLVEKLKMLEGRLGTYNVDKRLRAAQDEINSSISDICNNLDFENRFKPVKAYFDIKEFSFSVMDKFTGNKVSLSQLGSGSNWLAAHIGVFLSLLELSVKEQKSNLPSILFFDQPSQIYFPNEKTLKDEQNRNTEFEKVENIYKVILDKITSIKEKYGYSPQIIITDHADNLNLGAEYSFDEYVRKRWWSKEDEKALI